MCAMILIGCQCFCRSSYRSERDPMMSLPPSLSSQVWSDATIHLSWSIFKTIIVLVPVDGSLLQFLTAGGQLRPLTQNALLPPETVNGTE